MSQFLRHCRDQFGAALIITAFIALTVVASASAAIPTHFGEEGEGAGQLSREPIGVAVSQPSGDVLIADRNNQRAERFGAEGEFDFAWGWGVADGSAAAFQSCVATCFAGIEGFGAGQFDFPEGVAIDNSLLGEADVYVADQRNHRVEKFSPDGVFILMFGGEVNQTAVETPGSTQAERNLCTAASGDVCKQGTTGPGNGQFEQTFGAIAVDSAGTVYVGDVERVQKFSPKGAYVGQLTLTGGGDVSAVAVDRSKHLYVISSEVPGVRKFDGAGVEEGPARDVTGQPRSITSGPAEELFVDDGFDSEGHHILEFEADGTQTSAFDSGTEGGSRGIAYSENLGLLYVLNAGTVRLVTPPAPGPLVISQSSEAVLPTGATLGAVVNPEGPAVTSIHFEYGTSTTYGKSTKAEELKGEPFEEHTSSAVLTGLQPRTLYHYRIVVSNGSQTTDGPDQTFMTLPPVSIDGESASRVTASSAQLEAELNPHGLTSEYHFEYLTEAEFKANGESFTGAAKPVLAPSPPEAEGNAGSGVLDVLRSATIQGLAPSTTYYYRVVARNALDEPDEYLPGPDRSFVTQGAPGSVLPDGRQWELVSPPNKHGSPLEAITEEGGVIQAAADGGGLTYVAKGPVDSEPTGVRSPENTQLLAEREETGWVTQDVTTPYEEISILHAGFPSEYKLFSENLQAGVVEPEGATRLAPNDPANTERTPYRREADGDYLPLVDASNVPSGTSFGGAFSESTGTFDGGVAFVTATPDLSHLVLVSTQALTSGNFAPGFVPTDKPNLYEVFDGKLDLLSVLPSGEPTAEAGLAVRVGHNEFDRRGAISTDGNRVFFEASAENVGERLYVRDVGLGQTLQLNTPQGGPPGGPGNAIFQGASSDGDEVFFTDTARLTQPATAGASSPDLYMCKLTVTAGRLSCALSDLTVDPNPGEVADVQEDVAAIDDAGTHVYFAANGVLTNTPNARGEHAVPGDCAQQSEGATCNLYALDTLSGQIRLVAGLSSNDFPDWNPGGRHGLANLSARVSPNGRYFAFMSQRELTGYDNRDATSGKRDEEVFLFDAETGRTSCVSCDPTGARPLGVFDPETFPGLLVDHPHTWENHWLAASIPGWTGLSVTQALYQSRYLSNSGRMFFNAADALVPQDTDSVEDVYQYEPVGGAESAGQPASNSCTTESSTYSATSGGCVSLISSGTSKEESTFLDASETGDDVFFLTAAKLSPEDVDSAADVYDAHACSAESPCPPPPPPPPPACQGDACQNPVAAPNDATPGSLTAHGGGNLTPATKAAVKKKAKPLTRAQKLSKALKTCRKKKQGSKRAACEKAARQKYRPLTKAKKKKRK